MQLVRCERAIGTGCSRTGCSRAARAGRREQGGSLDERAMHGQSRRRSVSADTGAAEVDNMLCGEVWQARGGGLGAEHVMFAQAMPLPVAASWCAPMGLRGSKARWGAGLVWCWCGAAHVYWCAAKFYGVYGGPQPPPPSLPRLTAADGADARPRKGEIQRQSRQRTCSGGRARHRVC